MSIYVDASAFLKRYFDEPDSAECERIMHADPDWVTARHTRVEVRRNLARVLTGSGLAKVKAAFERDWARCNVVELDEVTCEVAATVAEGTGARTLDALHLGAAKRVADGTIGFLTYDVRQARAARALGWTVLGA